MIKQILETYSPKVIRAFIIALCFLCIVTVQGMHEREAQQFVMTIAISVIFGLLLRNIWLTGFLWWTLFLFCFFKFETGHTYLSNIFYCSILYYLTKTYFKKKHIKYFFNAIVVLMSINVLYAFIQLAGYDFIYGENFLTATAWKNHAINLKPTGFMGHASILGYLCALAVPICAMRRSKWGKMTLVLAFAGLYLSKASSCLLIAIIGLIFVSFFRVPRKLWWGIVIVLLIGGGSYLKWVDRPQRARLSQWQVVLRKATVRPITGWGLDSFRNITKTKTFNFATKVNKTWSKNVLHQNVHKWDNPHNLYVSLFFEWGVFGLVFLFGYVYSLFRMFRYSMKSDQTLALGAFCAIVLLISLAHFPMFLARTACFIIPGFALFELSMKKETYA